MRRSPFVLAPAVSLALLLASCGSDGSEGSTTTTTKPAAATTTTAGDATTSSAPADTTATTAPAGSTPTTVAEADLPGERLDLYPYEGAELAVVGVAPDDVLNLRTGPGTDFPVAYALANTVTGVLATGHNRSIDGGGVWVEVDADGHAGWANVAFLSQLGQVTDITGDLGSLPTAASLDDLAQQVADLRSSEEPPSKVTVVGRPDGGNDLDEIVVDVIGLGDDAQGGERLHVWATSADGTFTVETVEATALCTRGVTDDGLCV